LLFLIFAASLAPLRTGLWLGQVSMPAIALAILGAFVLGRDQATRRGGEEF
jgi:hypothetical protein